MTLSILACHSRHFHSIQSYLPLYLLGYLVSLLWIHKSKEMVQPSLFASYPQQGIPRLPQLLVTHTHISNFTLLFYFLTLFSLNLMGFVELCCKVWNFSSSWCVLSLWVIFAMAVLEFLCKVLDLACFYDFADQEYACDL